MYTELVALSMLLLAVFAAPNRRGHNEILTPRPVHSIMECPETVDGASVAVHRCVGSDTSGRMPGGAAARGPLDPILVFDVYDAMSRTQFAEGFPAHPHRGFLEVRYVTGGACIHHQDSCGGRGVTCPGSAQGLFAGRGIVHEELLAPPQSSSSSAKDTLTAEQDVSAGETFRGFQLWINVPQSQRGQPPKYFSGRVPLVALPEHGTVAVVAGVYEGTKGAMFSSLQESLLVGAAEMPFLILDVQLQGRRSWSLPTNRSNHVSVYVMTGCLTIDDENDDRDDRRVMAGLFLVTGPGDVFTATPCAGTVRFLLATGQRVAEPTVVSGGFVGATTQDLQRAYEDLSSGTSSHC
jgi:redox-sensitive bicupin YhaK (pirin superfamily)